MKYMLMPKCKRSMAAGNEEEKEMIALKQLGSFPIAEPCNSDKSRLEFSFPYKVQRAAN